jgi:hypothetical protein
MTSAQEEAATIEVGNVATAEGNTAIGSNINQVNVATMVVVLGGQVPGFEQLPELIEQVKVEAAAPAPRHKKVSGRPGAVKKVWQWRPGNGFARKLAAEHDDAAIVFPLNGPITPQVHNFIHDELHLEWDIFVITNAPHPHEVERLPTSVEAWEGIVASFKSLLAYLKEQGSKRIHLFFNGPVALVFTLGATAGIQPAQPLLLPVRQQDQQLLPHHADIERDAEWSQWRSGYMPAAPLVFAATLRHLTRALPNSHCIESGIIELLYSPIVKAASL